MMELAKRIEAPVERVEGPLVSAFVSLWRARWKSLAIVPVDGGLESLHRELQRITAQRAFAQARVIDACGRSLDSLPELLEAVRSSSGLRNIFVVDPPASNPVGQAIAQEADAAALVIRLGETRLEDARAVLSLVGRERFVGTLVLEGEAK